MEFVQRRIRNERIAFCFVTGWNTCEENWRIILGRKWPHWKRCSSIETDCGAHEHWIPLSSVHSHLGNRVDPDHAAKVSCHWILQLCGRVRRNLFIIRLLRLFILQGKIHTQAARVKLMYFRHQTSLKATSETFWKHISSWNGGTAVAHMFDFSSQDQRGVRESVLIVLPADGPKMRRACSFSFPLDNSSQSYMGLQRHM